MDLYPTSSQGLNCSQGSSFPNTVANTTDSRVCGNGLNRTLVESCCNGAEVMDSNCQFYCSYTGTISDWVNCITENNYTSSYAFCIGGTVSNITETVAPTSFAFRRFTVPKTTWLIFTLLFTFFFITPIDAAIVHSLDPHYYKRQSSDCTLSIASNFTRSGNSQRVSESFPCTDDPFCAQVLSVETAMDQNNRTINNTFAADPQYDAFFDILSEQTGGRIYPAMSSLNTTFEFVVPAQDNVEYFLAWTPASFCVNGTMTSCAGTLGDSNDEMPFEACGPLFVGGNVMHADDPEAVLFGTINYVTSA